MPARWRDRGSKDPADAVGLACLKTASKQCSECDADLCESHVETCAMCRAVFFPPCLSLHQEQHPKAASADRTTSGAKECLVRLAEIVHCLNRKACRALNCTRVYWHPT